MRRRETHLLRGVNQVAESFGAAKHRLARSLNLRRRIPEDVKLKVRRRPMNCALKARAALLHGLPGDGQGMLRDCPISIGSRVTPPDLGFDLVTGNLAGGAHGMIVVPRLNLRKRAPAIHRLKLTAEAKDQPNDHGAAPRFHSSKHYGAPESRSRASEIRRIGGTLLCRLVPLEPSPCPDTGHYCPRLRGQQRVQPTTAECCGRWGNPGQASAVPRSFSLTLTSTPAIVRIAS